MINGLKVCRIKVKGFSFYLPDGTISDGREFDAVILDGKDAMVPIFNTYMWVPSSNFEVLEDVSEKSAGNDAPMLSLVGIIGEKPQNITITF